MKEVMRGNKKPDDGPPVAANSAKPTREWRSVKYRWSIWIGPVGDHRAKPRQPSKGGQLKQ